MEETLLVGNFQMLPACKNIFVVNLTRKNVMFKEQVASNAQGKFTSLLIENIIGSKMYENKIVNDAACFFEIIRLAKNKKGIRQRKTYTFRVYESEDKQENRTICETWVRTFSWLLQDSNIDITELQEKESFPPPKNFLILINPKSGPGKSLQHFKKTIEPLLLSSNVTFKTIVTEYAGHCINVAIEMDIKIWDGVIICSGDGLVYEYLNGIMKRADWKDALKLPVGTLPTGSGNALCSSILHSAKETYSIVNAVYVILKGISQPMDLFAVRTEAETVYGFLSVTWGFMSDVDIESEKYRMLGGFRFTITSLQRILKLRHYKGKLHYLPGTKSNNLEQGVEIDEKYTLNSGVSKLSVQRHEVNGVVDDSQTTSLVQVALEVPINTDERIATPTQPPPPPFPSLTTDIPSDWETIDGEFVTIGVTSLSHLASDMYSSPGSFFNDSLLNIQYVRKGITKKKLLDVFTAFKFGTHLEYDEVEELYVKEFRLEPVMDMIGNMAVDGEAVKYGKVHAKILPSLGNIIMMPVATE